MVGSGKALTQEPVRADALAENHSARLRIIDLRSQLAGPFNLTVSPGECIAITGPSGSGKSLFLRMIADLDSGQGEVFLDNVERRTFTAPTWRRQVVYNSAEPGWWDERVAEHFHGSTTEFARAMAPRLLLSPSLLDAMVVQLSTGERQRLALIRALALASPVLLLDEATGALDEQATACVETVLRERLANGVAIVMVTHSPEQAGRLGHRQLRMQARHLVAA